eukprot:TRINITY_DN12576_c0_g1_i1.p1 TRINITY_DN12576_c0_g1~~TRINITY_DN12576_c0_g1_i1.p1  ORF type:complete len:346 (+),score=56.53 TRINITY_DN12576_c0_g1_i1:26-1063(+)
MLRGVGGGLTRAACWRAVPPSVRSNPSHHHDYRWKYSQQRRRYGRMEEGTLSSGERSFGFISPLAASFILGGAATAYLIHIYQEYIDSDSFPLAEAQSKNTPSTDASVASDTTTTHSTLKSIKESAETTVEPRSGSAVPNWIQLESDKQQQMLIGTSVRTVTVFGFLTYTMAVYADANDLRNAWNSAAQLSSAAVATNSIGSNAAHPAADTTRADQTLIKLIQDAQNTRTIRIVNYRKIDSSHFCHSLSTGLTDRWRRLGLDASSLEPNIAAFRAFFKTKDLPAGTVIDFAFRRGSLNVFVNGVAVGVLSNKEWEQQFLGMFLGERARAEAMRADIAAAVLKKSL